MRKRPSYSQVLSAAAVVALLLICNFPTSADDEVAIIVNSANTVSSLTPADLHRIYMGDKSTWPNGKHILLVMAPPGSPERATILKDVYKMTETDYSKYFLQATFTGAVSAPPKDAASTSEVKQFVAANPGAIGYVKQDDADNSVKVLLKVP
jgi:ABC-type phosphate transport system substrate-binding protein